MIPYIIIFWFIGLSGIMVAAKLDNEPIIVKQIPAVMLASFFGPFIYLWFWSDVIEPGLRRIPTCYKILARIDSFVNFRVW